MPLLTYFIFYFDFKVPGWVTLGICFAFEKNTVFNRRDNVKRLYGQKNISE